MILRRNHYECNVFAPLRGWYDAVADKGMTVFVLAPLRGWYD